MSSQPPRVVVLAGPNGAGKSTIAEEVLRGPFRVEEFVNADVIARGLSAFAPETVAWQAGRFMLRRLDELAAQRADFAFETTLASRTFAPWLKRLIATGYEFHLVFLWLPDADAAIGRVSRRVATGGHSVPENTVRRRYQAGLVNFFSIYQPLAATWRVLHNIGEDAPSTVAEWAGTGETVIWDLAIWNRIKASHHEK